VTIARIKSLDGLRGVAALVVVSHHVMFSTRFGDVFGSGDFLAPSGSAVFWLFRTPIAYGFAGTEAVIVFFVLSGFVLSSTALRRGFDWVDYSVKRVLRLWVPAAAAILLSVGLILATHQRLLKGQSQWFQGASTPILSPAELANSFDLFFGTPRLDNPLWTLKWELLFSLALPVFMAMAWALNRLGFTLSLTILSLISLMGVVLQVECLWLLPAFLGGSVLFYTLREGQRTLGAGLEATFGLLGLTLLTAAISVGILTGHGQLDSRVGHWLTWLFIPGAVLVVRATLVFRPLAFLLSLRPAQYLGKISFSLYLVHVPILVAVAHLLGGGRSLWAAPIGFLLALIAAPLFWRFVEMPAMRLARLCGARFSEIWTRLVP
jgi:peptidoglycan/LPS O-acetylase OafA/YrhL